MRLIIGLTGGIGSGKSTVAKEFSTLGVTVIDADKVAREVVEPGQPALAEIQLYFGKEVIDAGGKLKRAVLREQIFQSEEKKQWLNDLLHPLIREAMLKQLQEARGHYAMLEAPLLFENNLTGYTQYNVVVDLPEALQIERSMKRDGNTQSQIQAIMKAQWNRASRLAKADFIIDNTSPDLQALKQQVLQLHEQFLSLS